MYARTNKCYSEPVTFVLAYSTVLDGKKLQLMRVRFACMGLKLMSSLLKKIGRWVQEVSGYVIQKWCHKHPCDLFICSFGNSLYLRFVEWRVFVVDCIASNDNTTLTGSSRVVPINLERYAFYVYPALVLRPFVLLRFALTPLANLRHFLTRALLFSV
jgi:hypothetical protein